MPEIVVVRGKEYKMTTLPLESYWNKANPKPQFNVFLSGRRRGYLGKWAIRNQNLYLTHIEGWCIGLTPEYRPVPNGTSEVNPGTKTSSIRSWPFKSIYLRVLFPNADVSGQLAFWYTGKLLIGMGRGLKDFPFPFYKKLLIVSIENGKVVEEKIITRERKPK